MAIHILGNGPSLRLFDRNEWPYSDIFVGCNFSNVDLRPDYTVIIDAGAMKMFRGGDKGYKLEIPAVVTQRAYDYIDKDSGGWQTMQPGLINIVDVIPLERDKKIARKLAMNSGQHATLYAIKNHPDHDIIHVWGTDSFWSDDLESATDAIVRKNQRGRRVKPSVTKQWNDYWKKIFKDHSDHTFVIHRPSDATLMSSVLSQSNVRLETEQR